MSSFTEGTDASYQNQGYHMAREQFEPAASLAGIPKVATQTVVETPTATPVCTSAWSIVSSPNPDYGLNVLYGVAPISFSDAWAVGSYAGNTMTLHWNGNQWIHISSPNRPNEDHLRGVTAISTDDVWAVGWSHDPNTGWFTLVEHWDGTQWSIIPSPNPQGSVESYLNGISVVSANDVWAVGYYAGNGAYLTLIDHWDGSQWSIVPSPNGDIQTNTLYGVAAISANDVWASGQAGINPTLPLIEHWNGQQWSVVSNPIPPNAQGAGLGAIDATSSNDVWVVGGYHTGPGTDSTLVEHWDGSQWTIVPSPDLNPGTNGLYGVAAISTADAWAVGYYVGSYGATIIEHWDGTQWSIVPSPNPGNNDNILEAVRAASSGDVWAVGWWDTCLGCPLFTLTEHYTSSCASPSPSPFPSPFPSPTSTFSTTRTPIPTGTATPTSTPAAIGTSSMTITATPTQAASITATTTAIPTSTGTPASTSTACPVQFIDVPPGSTFYLFIRCLACMGIISGYSSGCATGDPCFRPNNDVTRGQLSKIISNSAGFTESHTEQTFSDVPSGSTFYQFIERMASRGIIGGYPCGGATEPCDDQHRPYFRSGANATRGQIAKIDVLAAVQSLGWTLLHPADSTFEDVGVGTTFYQYIETAYAHNVIGGYPCGVPPAGGCVPPLNKPFFVPNNSATRGQTSKIVANTFLPDCQTPSMQATLVDKEQGAARDNE